MKKDIFTKWVAEELAKRGHVYETKPNKKLPRYKVFVFENTFKFEKDLIEITQKRLPINEFYNPSMKKRLS